MDDRAPRYDNHIEIAASCNQVNFHSFYSLNISSSGLLIATNHPVPFKKGDILEIVIDPWKEILDSAISCNARVARLAKTGSKGLDKYLQLLGESPDIQSIFGIIFENMSEPYQKIWDKYVDSVKLKKT